MSKTFLTTYVQTGDTIANAASGVFSTQLSLEIVGLIAVAGGGNYNDVGRAYRITGYGLITTLSSPGTLTMNVQHNSNGTFTTLGSTGAITPPASLTNAPFKLEGIAVWNSTGATGKAKFDGMLEIVNASNVPTKYGMIAAGSAVADMVATNTTASTKQYLVASVAWATANAGNSITMQQLCFERIA